MSPEAVTLPGTEQMENKRLYWIGVFLNAISIALSLAQIATAAM
jgi:hypothetical protein